LGFTFSYWRKYIHTFIDTSVFTNFIANSRLVQLLKLGGFQKRKLLTEKIVEVILFLKIPGHPIILVIPISCFCFKS